MKHASICLAALLSLLLLLSLCCAAAEETGPVALPQSQTMAEAKTFVDIVDLKDPQPLSVQAGRIRHVAQEPTKSYFCKAYWVDENFDLSARKAPSGRKYGYYAGNMCTRAAYCEALSYLGIDMTPVAMNTMMNSRNLDNPYDEVTAKVPGLTRTKSSSNRELWNMVNRYLEDPTYSPVVMVLMYPKTGTFHTLLIIGVNKNGRAIVLDSAYRPTHGKETFVFTVKIAANGSRLKSSDVYAYKGTTVRAAYQWHYEKPSEP